MSFDIHRFSSQEADERISNEKEFEQYMTELVEIFHESPEGKAYLEVATDSGSWCWPFLHYGSTHFGVTPPEMDTEHVVQLMLDIFPRKVSLISGENVDEIITELLAFWRFLQREFDLPNAGGIVKLLHEIKSEFKERMFDPRNYGPAKSMVMAGRAAGYDMTDEEEMQRFIVEYNASLAERTHIDEYQGGDYPEGQFAGSRSPGSGKTKISKEKKKKLRNLAKLARKKNKKKKKKR